MASISTDTEGRRRILFALEGKRKTLRLGKCSARDAEKVRGMVDDLLASIERGRPPEDATKNWLEDIGDTLHARLAAVDLTKPRSQPVSLKLADFTDAYIKTKTVKAGTLAVMKQGRDSLVGYFTADRTIDSITAGEADSWRADMVGQGYADATIRKRTTIAKQVFRHALRRKLIDSNPFADLASATRGNADRQRFISRADADKVIAACPDAQWRLLFALSRYGGLRCPSEHLALKWTDVNWEQGRFTVHSSKTEHHEGKATRVVPIFPELYPYLRECRDLAAPGETHVITRYRDTNCNLRTQLHRIIDRAGLKPWPKTFHNLRATRETELAETFPEHVVCQWIGNSVTVARKHYMQVTDEHFERASQKATQNPTQQAPVFHCKPSQPTKPQTPETPLLRGLAAISNILQSIKVGALGFEPRTEGL